MRSPRVYLLLAFLLPAPALAQSTPDRPRPTLDSLPPLPPLDTSPCFQAVTDRRPIEFDDTAAYAELLRRARETPPEELDRIARRDVLFSHLLSNPARYRGLPIHLQGTARRVLSLPDVSEALSPSGRLHEAWVFTADSQGFPYDLVFETPPPGLPAGDQVDAFVVFRGYFLKLMAYRAGDKARVAPLLIGQLEYVPRPSSGVLPSTSPPSSRLLWTALPIAALLVYALFRIVFVIRRLDRFSPTRDFLRRSPRQDITPEALQAWLSSPPQCPSPRPRRRSRRPPRSRPPLLIVSWSPLANQFLCSLPLPDDLLKARFHPFLPPLRTSHDDARPTARRCPIYAMIEAARPRRTK